MEEMIYVVYIQWRYDYEIDFIGAYKDEEKAIKVAENIEHELEAEGHDIDDEVRVWYDTTTLE